MDAVTQSLNTYMDQCAEEGARIDAYEAIWQPLNRVLQDAAKRELLNIPAGVKDIIERAAGDIADEFIGERE